MTQATLPTESRRLISLDAFRGITIAGMILVNNPGSWSHIYPPLEHAHWNGWTPTDLVFPFFLFIVGVSLAFSFRRRLEHDSRVDLFAQVVRRSVIIFALGLIMAGFPDFELIGPYILAIVGINFACWDHPVLRFGPTPGALARKFIGWALLIGAVVYFALDFPYFQDKALRVPGVLQRIAVCYFFGSLIVMVGGTKLRVACVVVLLVGYCAIVSYVHPPAGFTAHVGGSEGLLHEWIDMHLLGNHVYSERPDPEGILSTLPAIATVLLGALVGQWLQTERDKPSKAAGLFFAANLLLFVGLCWNPWFPINKKIWTSSYVLLMAGLAMHFLAMCYWLIDIHGRRGWAWPFLVFGSNAITVYVASSLTAKMLVRTKLTLADGNTIAVKTWIYEHLLASWAEPTCASLLYPLIYITLWLLPMIVLYRRRIFIKV